MLKGVIMMSINPDMVSGVPVRACKQFAGVLVLVLTGCQTIGDNKIAAHEYLNFTPKTPDQRIMNEVKLRWEVREDVAPYCAQSLGIDREQANLTPPIACAIWHVQKKECVIITGNPTSNVVIGHEVRHCFEGQYH